MYKERDFFQRFVDEHPKYEPFRDDPLIRWRVISEASAILEIKDQLHAFLDDAVEKRYKLDALTDIVDLSDATYGNDKTLIEHFQAQINSRKAESEDYTVAFERIKTLNEQIEVRLLQHGLDEKTAKTDVSMDIHFLLRCLYTSGKPYISIEQFIATLPPELTGLESSQN